MVSFRFQDRAQAGRALAEKLAGFSNRPEVVVLGLPRGGVPVAFEVARRLHAPLDAFLVRKLGVPGHEELAMGAIATGNICFLNDNVIHSLGISPDVVEQAIARERRELEQRERAFRLGQPVELRDRVVILVDDGLATGATMRAAVIAVRERQPARVVVAVPVAARDTHKEFKQQADDIVCVQTPVNFEGVGQWYEDFTQTSDEEVRALLEEGAQFGRDQTRSAPVEEAVSLRAGNVMLEGNLGLPAGAAGVVLFAHGSGSSRHSVRNRAVAAALRQAGLGTLLLDLLSPQEEAMDARTMHLRFDITLLAERLVAALDWLSHRAEARGLPLGLFGASTGAAAALVAAAQRPAKAGAVVSRGGRPDLAGDALPEVQAPTLLVVGENDPEVLTLNRRAQRQLRCRHELAIVPGASHLFEEPGTLDKVARLAGDWFLRQLRKE
jgi:putative phosphoribosyl transferase